MHKAKRMKVFDSLKNPMEVLFERIIDVLMSTSPEHILVQPFRIDFPEQGVLVSFEAKTSSPTILLSTAVVSSNIGVWMSAQDFTHFKLALNIILQVWTDEIAYVRRVYVTVFP